MDATTKFFLLCAYPDLALDDWITIKGTHVETDEGGNLKGAVGQKIAASKKASSNPSYLSQSNPIDTSKVKAKALPDRHITGTEKKHIPIALQWAIANGTNAAKVNNREYHFDFENGTGQVFEKNDKRTTIPHFTFTVGE